MATTSSIIRPIRNNLMRGLTDRAAGSSGGSLDPNDWFPSNSVTGDFWRIGDSTLATNSDGGGGVPALDAVCGYTSSLRAYAQAGIAGIPLTSTVSKPTYVADATYPSGALKMAAGLYSTVTADYGSFNPNESGYTAGALTRFSGSLAGSRAMITVGGDDDPVYAAVWNQTFGVIRHGQSPSVKNDYPLASLTQPDPTAWRAAVMRVTGNPVSGSTRTFSLYIGGVLVDSFTTTDDGSSSNRFLIFARAISVDMFFRAGFGMSADIGDAGVADLTTWLSEGAV